jgi:hypothetical protein
VGSSWARRVKAGIVGIVTSWGVIAAAPASAEVALRPVARDAQDGRPFAIVDKRQATLSVYAADGRLVGRTSALLGLTPGDAEPASARGKAPSALGAHERVTPAGRFEAVPGRNLNGERVVWFNYEANLAIHRLRPAAAAQHRPERLVSANVQDHRITLGCVVVDPAFFDEVVLPTLGGGPSRVYILPVRAPRDPGAGAGRPPHAAAAP